MGRHRLKLEHDLSKCYELIVDHDDHYYRRVEYQRGNYQIFFDVPNAIIYYEVRRNREIPFWLDLIFDIILFCVQCCICCTLVFIICFFIYLDLPPNFDELDIFFSTLLALWTAFLGYFYAREK